MTHDERTARIERVKANVADLKADIQQYGLHDGVSVRDIRLKMSAALSQGLDGEASEDALLAVIKLGIEAIDAQEKHADRMARDVRNILDAKEVSL